MAERVVDKERANFCEYFGPVREGRAGASAPPSAARTVLENLFKKKG